MDPPQSVEQIESEAVFSLLAVDNRAVIVRALWNVVNGLSFSDRSDAVDLSDSRQLNYHLDTLVGQFLTRTDDGNNERTAAGRQSNGAIEAGASTASGRIESMLLDHPCGACGETQTVSYRSERVTVKCESCGGRSSDAVPPSAFADCDHGKMPWVAGRYLLMLLDRFDAGVCS